MRVRAIPLIAIMNHRRNGLHTSRTWIQAAIILVLAAMASCTSPKLNFAAGGGLQRFRRSQPEPEPQKTQFVVKTTAYCHQEADSQPYGKLTARGTVLRCSGPVRSAAADWSRYPVGTRFRIIGQSQLYEVDDYGSALVGTDTIDIYQPTLRSMRSWGAPVVGIEVVQWGSYAESEAILAPRATKSTYVRQMLSGVRIKSQQAQLGVQPAAGPIGMPPVPQSTRTSA